MILAFAHAHFATHDLGAAGKTDIADMPPLRAGLASVELQKHITIIRLEEKSTDATHVRQNDARQIPDFSCQSFAKQEQMPQLSSELLSLARPLVGLLLAGGYSLDDLGKRCGKVPRIIARAGLTTGPASSGYGRRAGGHRPRSGALAI